jgi:putative redox protein
MSQPLNATLVWQRQGLEFEGTIAGAPATHIDGDNHTAPGPMAQLLLAASACTGSDVVLILEKMRAGLTEFRIEAAGTRREETPRRFTAIHFVYHLRGKDLDDTRARRAIDLSLEKYCSVVHSLAPDIGITYDVDVG